MTVADRGPDGRYRSTEKANALLRQALRDRSRYEVIPARVKPEPANADANALLRRIVAGASDSKAATRESVLRMLVTKPEPTTETPPADKPDPNALLRAIARGTTE